MAKNQHLPTKMSEKLPAGPAAAPALPSGMTDSVEKLMFLPDSLTQTSAWHNRKCLLYCFILYLCSFFTAYEQGITNGFLALPAFVEAFGPVMPSSSGSGSGSGAGKHYVNTSLQQLLFVVSDLGWLSTLCVAWLLYERVGRVRVLQIGLATSIAAIVLATAAPNRETFLTARFFIGGGVGFISSASFLWVGESTVAHIRNVSSVFHGLKMAIGYLLSAIVCHLFSHGTAPRNYRIPMIIGMGPQVLSLALTFVLPETPRWYALQSRRTDAYRSLQSLRPRTHTPAMITQELDAIFAAIEWERSAAGTSGSRLGRTLRQVREAFTGTNARRTGLSMANGVFFVASGVQFVVTTAAYLFSLMGSTQPFYYTIVMKSIAVPSALLAAFTLDGLPRRTIILWSFILNLIAMIGTGILSSLPASAGLSDDGKIKGLTAFFSLAILAVYGGANISMGTMMVELPRQELRALTYSLGAGLAIVVGIVHNLVTPEFINPEDLNWGGKYAYIFVGTNLICLVFVYFYLPETRNITLEEMDVLFEAKVPARRFQEYIKAQRAQAARERDDHRAGSEGGSDKAGEGGSEARAEELC